MNNVSRDEFLSSISRLAASVYDFHERFRRPDEIESPSTAEYLGALRARLPLIVEELGEHSKELNNANLERASLELADVAFVAIGSVLALDTNGTGACHAVAIKNDSKNHNTHVYEESSGKLVRRVPGK